MNHYLINYNLFSKEKNVLFHYMDTDSLVVSVETKDIIRDLKKLDQLFDFINLTETLGVFINENEKVIRNLKKETPENIWIDQFICLRTKMYAF